MDYADGRVGGLIRDCVGGAPKESTSTSAGGPLNYEKAAPSSLEQSCGQGMHIVVMADITHLPSLFLVLLFLSCFV